MESRFVEAKEAEDSSWRFWKDSSHAHESYSTRLLAESHRPGDSILEVGCGAGHFLKSLNVGLNDSFTYHGLDIAAECIKSAHKVYGQLGNVDFEVGDACALEFADQVFAYTVCLNLIPRLPNAAQALREMLRVTSRALLVRMLIGNEEIISKNGAPCLNIYTERFVRKTFGFTNVKVDFLEDTMGFPWKTLRVTRLGHREIIQG